MNTAPDQLHIVNDAPISTWFHIGGGADRLARPNTQEELQRCLEIDDELRVLGEGANLLVDDDGVSDLVVSLQQGAFTECVIDDTAGLVHAGAGVALPGLINRCVRSGLGGLEKLAGIPATLGGAVIMNAGGAFGEISQYVVQVSAIDRAGRSHIYDRAHIDFGYRQSLLNHLIITGVVLQLEPGDHDEIARSRAECMKYKAESQPLGDKSAGCVFKNPTLIDPIEDIADAGERVSAGMLIDRAGCKGMSIGGACVSQVHANFITTSADARASHVIELIEQTRLRVFDRFGVSLHNELVIWSDRKEDPTP
ncbi:MAG: UDP-N-acetylmuramate dehydrogenase [Phycisphaerales bacterium JB047]